MKKLIIAIIILFAVTTISNAQERQARNADNKAQTEKNVKTPEMKAQKLTDKAKEQLGLNEEQKIYFYNLALEYYNKEAELRRQNNGDEEKVKLELKNVRKEMIEKSKTFLNAEQVEKLKKEIEQKVDNKK